MSGAKLSVLVRELVTQLNLRVILFTYYFEDGWLISIENI